MADWDRAINDLHVWIGRKVNSPHGLGEITGVTECEEGDGGIGPDRHTVEGIRVDKAWYPVSTIVALNKTLILPKERTSATDIEGPNEDWIS